MLTGTARLVAIAIVQTMIDLSVIACGPQQPLPPAGGQGSSALTPASVTEISLERRCMGCDREMKLTLRRDGTAIRTMFGNARRGTTDRQSTATIAATAFDELAAAAMTAAFFQLQDEYRDPAVADGESIATTVLAAGREKAVLHRHNKGPDALKRFEAAIERIGNTLVWKTVG